MLEHSLQYSMKSGVNWGTWMFFSLVGIHVCICSLDYSTVSSPVCMFISVIGSLSYPFSLTGYLWWICRLCGFILSLHRNLPLVGWNPIWTLCYYFVQLTYTAQTLSDVTTWTRYIKAFVGRQPKRATLANSSPLPLKAWVPCFSSLSWSTNILVLLWVFHNYENTILQCLPSHSSFLIKKKNILFS